VVCYSALVIRWRHDLTLCRAPAIEDQAVDRVHRLGQKKETRVVRLVIHDSIERRRWRFRKTKENSWWVLLE
jgi:SNF2 family DNA or RNA helicase